MQISIKTSTVNIYPFMKFFIYSLFVFIVNIGFPQKLKQKDIVNTQWELVIDIQGEFEESRADADNSFERILIGGISGIVESLIGNLDMKMDFVDDENVEITVTAFGMNEIDHLTWKVKDGVLQISNVGNNAKFQINDNNSWIKGGSNILIPIDEAQNIYLRRID